MRQLRIFKIHSDYKLSFNDAYNQRIHYRTQAMEIESEIKSLEHKIQVLERSKQILQEAVRELTHKKFELAVRN